MEAKMFCYQCQETMKGTGCILKGVCGKESHTAKAMDLLMFVVRGISVVTDEFRNAGHSVAAEVNRFVVDALFRFLSGHISSQEEIFYLLLTLNVFQPVGCSIIIILSA